MRSNVDRPFFFSFYTLPTLLASACIVVIAAGTLVSGCGLFGSGGSGNRDGSDALVPLAEGERWTYRNEEGETSVIEAVGTSSATVTSEGESRTLPVERQENGLSISPSGQREEAFLFRYPADVGETYTVRTGGEGEVHTVEVGRASTARLTTA